MDNVTIFNLILLQIYSVLICSIKLSIKLFTLQQTDWIAQSCTLIFDMQFWLSDSSKTCNWHSKPWHSNCFFFVTTSLNSSIKLSIESFMLVAQRRTKRLLFLAAFRTKLTEIAPKVEHLESRQKSNSFFSIKYSLTFSKKITIGKLTFVKEDLIEKPSISILTPEIVLSRLSKECF